MPIETCLVYTGESEAMRIGSIPALQGEVKSETCRDCMGIGIRRAVSNSFSWFTRSKIFGLWSRKPDSTIRMKKSHSMDVFKLHSFPLANPHHHLPTVDVA